MKDRFRAIRKHFGLTQEQFAKRINKTASFVSTVETGRCGLSSTTVNTICNVFSVNEQWLRGGIGEMFAHGEEKAAVNKEKIGGRIKMIRKKYTLTQQKFADKIGFHKNQVYNVENGKSVPSEEFISSVATQFGLNIDWIKTGEGKITADYEIDEKLLEWLRNHPEVIMELRIRSGLS